MLVSQGLCAKFHLCTQRRLKENSSVSAQIMFLVARVINTLSISSTSRRHQSNHRSEIQPPVNILQNATLSDTKNDVPIEEIHFRSFAKDLVYRYMVVFRPLAFVRICHITISICSVDYSRVRLPSIVC